MREPSRAQLVSDLRDAKREIAEMSQKLSLAEPFIDLITQLRNLEQRIASLEYRVPEDMD
jgi:hypothetical protein